MNRAQRRKVKRMPTIPLPGTALEEQIALEWVTQQMEIAKLSGKTLELSEADFIEHLKKVSNDKLDIIPKENAEVEDVKYCVTCDEPQCTCG